VACVRHMVNGSVRREVRSFSGIIAGDLGIATLVVPEADLDETSRKAREQARERPNQGLCGSAHASQSVVGGRHRRSGRDDARRGDRPL
jgi:hypothetical protein